MCHMATATLNRHRIRIVNVLEFTQATQRHRVDRERGVIHNVKILGRKSRNGQTYSNAAISRGRSLYEGATVFADHPRHPDDERRIEDQLGWLEGVYEQPDGLHAREFHFVKSHPLASMLCEVAERRPDKWGFSHNAKCNLNRSVPGGVYESINLVRSVDVVCNPATTRGVFESFRGDPMETITFFDLFAAKAREVFDNEDIDQTQKPAAIGRLAKLIFAAEESMARTDTSDGEADDASDSGGLSNSTPATESYHPVDRRQLPPREDRAAAFAEADAIAAGHRPARVAGRATVRRSVLEQRRRTTPILNRADAFRVADSIMGGRRHFTAADLNETSKAIQAADTSMFRIRY